MMRNTMGIFLPKKQQCFTVTTTEIKKDEVNSVKGVPISVLEDKYAESIFSTANLTSQLYERKYLIINVYESDKIEFMTVNDADNIQHIALEAEGNLKSENISKKDEIIVRVALYDFIDSSLLATANQTHIQGSMYGSAIARLARSVFAVARPLTKINNNRNDFYEFLNYCKKHEHEKADAALKIVMEQHYQKHDCFDRYNQPFISRCVIS